MLNFSFNKKKPLERGYFGYYGLIDWWDTDFTEEEKTMFWGAYIRTPAPIRLISSYDRFFKGKEHPLNGYIGIVGKTPLGFLEMLLGHLLEAGRCEDLCHKFVEKCNQLIDEKSDPLALHFFYSHQITFYISLMEKDSSYELALLNACENQIAIIHDARKAFIERLGKIPKHHNGLEMLIHYHESRWDLEKALIQLKRAKSIWDMNHLVSYYECWIQQLLIGRHTEAAGKVLELAKKGFPEKYEC